MSGQGPAKYTANVNRAKTKKWVEAKSYSYDGDDWGEVDDYDEYGGYDEPEPAHAPKPTGLRQQGQSATQRPQETPEARPKFYQSPVEDRQYGIIGGAPTQRQQQLHGAQSLSYAQPQQQPGMARPRSFDRDDEQQAFSAGGSQRSSLNLDYTPPAPQGQNISADDFQSQPQLQNFLSQPDPSPARPALYGSGRTSMEGQAKYGEKAQSPSGNSRRGPSIDQARQINMDSRTQSLTSNNSATDFGIRRDFSPSAMPPPLQTRGSPSIPGPEPYTSSRPPRKSSLGQGGEPAQSFPAEALPIPITKDREEDTAPARERAGSSTAKSLPFVRPAEIYRRMQEEKEKERQSQESSRPSMGAILGGSTDRPKLGRSQDSESSQRLKPILDPVKERKSEYGMEDVHLQDREAGGERRSTSSKTFEFPKRASNTGSEARKSSVGPMLPDVSRVSGFGESFFGTTESSGEDSQDPVLRFAGSSTPQPTSQPRRNAPEKELQHQPSLGFTSAVHQAFDKAEDQVPPTPSSTQGSSVGRSTSGGTSTVSPIISRGPSTATENWNSRLPGIDHVATPMIPEGPEGGSPRPISSGSLGMQTQVARRPSEFQSSPPPETEAPPPSFIPGYRRNSDTPSPDNSPRRTPALETNRQLRQPQEVEIAAATPTDPSHSTGSDSQASKVSLEEALRREQTIRPRTDPSGSHIISAGAQDAPGKQAGFTDTINSPISPSHNRLRDRTDSSSSSRVRNLADKFENSSRPGSAHSTTPRASLLGNTAQKKEDLGPPRPVADRMESFRPHLPGGWESSASIGPAAAFGTPRALQAQRQTDQIEPSPNTTPETSNVVGKESKDEKSSTRDQQSSTIAQVKDASHEALAAAAAAGSALAGAFGAVAGMEHHDSSSASTAGTTPEEPMPQKQYEDDAPVIRNQGSLYPEASRPQRAVASDGETSTAALTPPQEDVGEEPAAPSNGLDYHSSSTHQDFEHSSSIGSDTKPMKQPPALPLLSTDARPQQYESDRLRKEIVRELTPMSDSEPTTAETDYSNYQPTLSTNPSVSHPRHESGVLPKEYESYWNDAASDGEVDDVNKSLDRLEDAESFERQQDAVAVVQPLQPNQGHERSIPVSTLPDEPPRERSPMLPHRFSWEQPLEDLSPKPKSDYEQPVGPSSDFLKASVYPEDHFQSPDESREARPIFTSPSEPERMTFDSPSVPEKDLPLSGSSDRSQSLAADAAGKKELPGFPSDLEPVSPSADKQPDQSFVAERELPSNDIRQQVSMVPKDRRQGPEPPRPGAPDDISSIALTRSYDYPSIPPPTDALPKIPAIREILALKSPTERISAYNATREQYANLNTGLAHWLAVTVTDLPEHADLLTNSRPVPQDIQGHRPSPSRSKLGGLLPSGGQPNQQPYFQQYLNASPQPTAPNGNAPGGLVGGGSSQGLSPSGGSSGKLSSQQVQAKGKDLLHTAGVFGGKANVAAKGLFSKGKSKLRAASGNEKV